MALRAGGFRSAQTFFRKVLARSPGSVEATAGLGLALLEQGRAGEAVAQLTSARRDRPGDVAIKFTLARALLQTGEAAGAASMFEEVRSQRPDWPDIGYHLGVAQFRTGRHAEALDAFRRGPVSSAATRESARLYEATVLARLGREQEAREHLTALLREAPVPEIAGGARIALGSLPGQPRRPRTRGSIRIGQQYDTNATVVPTTNVFGLRDQRQASAGTVVNAQIIHDLEAGPLRDVTVAYGLLQTMNYRVPNVNAQDHTLTLEAAWSARFGRRRGLVALPLVVDHLLLDESSILQRTAVALALTLLGGRGHATTVQLGATHKDYRRQGASEGTSEDRDGWNHALGVSHDLPIGGGRWRGNIAVTYDAENAQGTNLDHDGVRVAVGAGGRLRDSRFALHLQAQHHDRGYGNRHSFFLRKRDDDETTLYAMLAYRLSGKRTLTLEYLGDRNRSNLALYSFDKEMATAAIRWTF